MDSKRFIVQVFFAICFLQVSYCVKKGYSHAFENLHVNEILNNATLRNAYMNCVIDEGPCNYPEAKYIRERAPEIFLTYCKDCTPLQITKYFKLTMWFLIHEPEKMNKVMAKVQREFKKRNYPDNKIVID